MKVSRGESETRPYQPNQPSTIIEVKKLFHAAAAASTLVNMAPISGLSIVPLLSYR